MVILQVTLSSAIAGPVQTVEIKSEPPVWPEGSVAYDNMVQMADFDIKKSTQKPILMQEIG